MVRIRAVVMVTYVDGRMVNSTSDGNFECIVV